MKRLTFIGIDGREKTFSGITDIIKDGQPLDLESRGLLAKLFSGRLMIHYAGGKIAAVDGDKVKQILP